MKHYGLERIVIDTPITMIDPALGGLTIPPTHVPPGTVKVYVKDVGAGEKVLCIMDEDLNEFCTDVTSGFAVPHNILSAVHTDSLTAAVVRGDLIVGNSTPKWARFAKGVAGDILRINPAGTDPLWEAHHGAIVATIDAGPDFIPAGILGDLYVPRSVTLTDVTLLADQAGNIVLDIWKDTYANYPPTVADSITAAAKPTLLGAIKSQDNLLLGWTKLLNVGDTLRFNVDSASTVRRVTMTLAYTRN